MKLKKGKKSLKKAKGPSHPEAGKVKTDAVRTQATADTDDDEVDYGGLPAIDLKKNLGCG